MVMVKLNGYQNIKELHKKVGNVLQSGYLSGNISLFKMTSALRTNPECGDSGQCEKGGVNMVRMPVTSFSHLDYNYDR